MKKLVFTILSILGTTVLCQAQLVLDFDTYASATNNDFENNFEFINSLSQIQTGGITGGCIEYSTAGSGGITAYSTPVFSWPTSNVMQGSIYFKLTTSVSGSASDALDFSFSPPDVINGGYSNTDGIGVQFEYDPTALNSRVQIYKGSSFGNITNFNTTLLTNNHWYKLKLVLDKNTANADEILASVTLEDFGLSGTQTPSMLAQKSNITVSLVEDLKSASSMQFQIIGRLQKGITHLDNLNIGAVAPTSTSNISPLINDIKLYPTVSKAAIHIELPEVINPLKVNGKVLDITGREVEEIQFDSEKKSIDISRYASGSYFITFYSNGVLIRSKRFVR